MTYGFVMDVPAPIEFYDAMHAETRRRAPDGVDGLLLHVCRQTPGGLCHGTFGAESPWQVTEIWEFKECSDRANAQIVGPAIAQLSAGRAPLRGPTMEEFQPRGLSSRRLPSPSDGRAAAAGIRA